MNNERMQLGYLDVFNNLNARNIFASGISAKTGKFENVNSNNLVYNTGNQTISGVKSFQNINTINLFFENNTDNFGITTQLQDGDLSFSLSLSNWFWH